jgi:hypothetical protein
MAIGIQGKTEEEKYQDAEKYMQMALLFLPDYSNFIFSTVIEDSFRGKDFAKDVYACNSQLQDILQREGYIEKGTGGNLTNRLTEKGREAKKVASDTETTLEDEVSIIDPYLKSQAEYLSKTSHIKTQSLAPELGEKIQKCLNQIYSKEDKAVFLKYYQKLMDEILFEHNKKCTNQDTCMYTFTNKMVRFNVNQELAKIKTEEEKERFWRFSTVIENLTIHGDGQILNFGKVEGDINHNIEKLNKGGEEQISNALKRLVEAIKDTNELEEEKKMAYLEQLKLLSEEALKPKEKRLPQSILKTIIKYGLGALNAASSISTVTGTTLPQIADYFLNP